MQENTNTTASHSNYAINCTSLDVYQSTIIRYYSNTVQGVCLTTKANQIQQSEPHHRNVPVVHSETNVMYDAKHT